MDTLRYGLDMYKQTMNMKKDPNSGADIPPGDPGVNLIKTVKNRSASPQDTREGVGDSKYRRVAKFLILIGSEQASEILAELDPDQVEKVSREIALIKFISPEEGKEIFDEFLSLFSRPYSYSGVSQGGIETARRILYASKGAKKGEAILNRAVPASRENLFSFLEDFSAGQLVMLLKNESAQTAALILSRLPAKVSAEALNNIPNEIKGDVLRRIAHQGEVSPEVLEQVASALKEKVRNISGRADDIEINGMETLAAILKQGDYSFGDRIINELEEDSPDIGKDLKEKLYTLDDVVNTVDKPIQGKLASMSEKDIAVLIKGRREEFREKILSCVSAGRRKLIREESELLGPIPKRECDAAANEFLAWFRLARENGDIILYNDKDVFI